MSTSLSSSKELGSSLSASPESAKLIVRQPAKLQELGNLLLTIEGLSQRVSERTGEDRSGDLGSGGTAGTGQGDDGTYVSPRDQAIAAMPAPAVIQKQLEKHIRKEVRELQTRARSIARLSQPGSAYLLTELYSRIRRLNQLLAEILEASVEVLKRFFIRVFIDQQPIL